MPRGRSPSWSTPNKSWRKTYHNHLIFFFNSISSRTVNTNPFLVVLKSSSPLLLSHKAWSWPPLGSDKTPSLWASLLNRRNVFWKPSFSTNYNSCSSLAQTSVRALTRNYWNNSVENPESGNAWPKTRLTSGTQIKQKIQSMKTIWSSGMSHQ